MKKFGDGGSDHSNSFFEHTSRYAILPMLSDCNKTTTSSSVHRMLELHSDAGLLLSSSGISGSESLKQLEKKEFRTFALSSSES